MLSGCAYPNSKSAPEPLYKPRQSNTMRYVAVVAIACLIIAPVASADDVDSAVDMAVDAATSSINQVAGTTTSWTDELSQTLVGGTNAIGDQITTGLAGHVEYFQDYGENWVLWAATFDPTPLAPTAEGVGCGGTWDPFGRGSVAGEAVHAWATSRDAFCDVIPAIAALVDHGQVFLRLVANAAEPMTAIVVSFVQSMQQVGIDLVDAVADVVATAEHSAAATLMIVVAFVDAADNITQQFVVDIGPGIGNLSGDLMNQVPGS